MLYPRENSFRECKSLDGMWEYRFDWKESGRAEGWSAGFEAESTMPVPASWNEFFCEQERRDFFGTCWYQTRIQVPARLKGRKLWLRFGSVSYRASVWLNGVHLGDTEGCHLPFEFSAEHAVEWGGENLLVVAVNAMLGPDTVPPGNLNVGGTIAGAAPTRSQPDVTFDFFPFGGILRPVVLYATEKIFLSDISVKTGFEGSKGWIDWSVAVEGAGGDTIEVALGDATIRSPLAEGTASGTLEIEDVKLWSPESPHLYPVRFRVLRNQEVVDEYTQRVGVRTVTWDESTIRLNGQPIYLKGFGRHEDFALNGRGLNLAVLKRDFEIMRWIGANSFRTTHYPHAEEVLEMADREGFLVISETAAVGIGTGGFGKALQKNHARAIERLMARDKNHPSVIMWCLANEPSSQLVESREYFRPLVDLARSLDSSRPLTIVSCDDPWIGRKPCQIRDFCDIICLNRYYGWYISQGRMDEAMANLSAEWDEIHAKTPKPIIMTEFGADCVAGLHSLPATIWSEEYQTELLSKTIQVLHEKPYSAGEHVWNLADFQTAQTHTRVVGNKKGVFTRERQPKSSAFVLKEIWSD
jgi:beta-glucuronidase